MSIQIKFKRFECSAKNLLFESDSQKYHGAKLGGASTYKRDFPIRSNNSIHTFIYILTF